MTQLNSNLAQAKAEIKALSIDKESLSTEVKNLRDTIIKRDGFIA
jgi:cell division protein FtsB